MEMALFIQDPVADIGFKTIFLTYWQLEKRDYWTVSWNRTSLELFAKLIT